MVTMQFTMAMGSKFLEEVPRGERESFLWTEQLTHFIIHTPIVRTTNYRRYSAMMPPKVVGKCDLVAEFDYTMYNADSKYYDMRTGQPK